MHCFAPFQWGKSGFGGYACDTFGLCLARNLGLAISGHRYEKFQNMPSAANAGDIFRLMILDLCVGFLGVCCGCGQ